MDFADKYAEMATSARFEDLPAHAVEMTKRFLLDAVGVSVAGRGEVEARSAVQLVRSWGGIPESSLFSSGERLPAPNAVFANSVMIHALDFDDTHDGAVVHAYVTNLPAAFAIAEQVGAVSGKDFILALNLGLDLTCRLGLAVGSAPGFGAKPVHFIRSAVCGGFGASVVAGKLMGFSQKQMVDALGIVLSQVGGTRQVVVDSAMTKRFQPAFAAKAGIVSAQMASLGVAGCHGVFEGDYGFFNIYWRGDYLREALTHNLGSHFEGVNLSFKPYPCCRYNHGAIDAALQCVQKHSLSAADVKKVIVHLPDQKFYDVVSRPFAVKENPTIDAQFNTSYSVASAIIDGFVSLDTYRVETVCQEIRKALADRVEVVTDYPVSDKKKLGPVTVEIQSHRGDVFAVTVEHFKGSPENTMTRNDCIEKFRRCLQYSGNPLTEVEQNRFVEMIFNLETSDDVSEILRCIT
jgi:2-methylcitrate dehydratase PrpD